MKTFISPLNVIHITQIVFIALISFGGTFVSGKAIAADIPKSVKPPADRILLTVSSKHDQSKKLGQSE